MLNCATFFKIYNGRIKIDKHLILYFRRDKMNKNKQNKQVKQQESGQPTPLSGSKKVKNRNHTRQKNDAGHDM